MHDAHKTMIPTEHVEDVATELARLHSSASGLTSKQADIRLTQVGLNALEEIKVSRWRRFVRFFWGPIPWMIELAALLSLVVGSYVDLGIIFVLLIANAVIGFIEESHADTALQALKNTLAPIAQVKRDGVWQRIKAERLVPGDYVRFHLGNIVPADVVLLVAESVRIDQSALTGESLPIDKVVGDRAFAGSIVKQGEAEGVVLATGTGTYFGTTARLVQADGPQSHFERAILRIGNFLIVLAAILVAVVLLVATWRGDSVLTTLEFALVLLVAAVPVAMPTVLSVTLAVGARFLATKGAVVTHLTSIEELAGVDVLCADKTGTLTKNELTLGESYVVGAESEEILKVYAALTAHDGDDDVIDETILAAVDEQVLALYRVCSFVPFDPVSKRAVATIEKDGSTFQVMKGAPQVVLAASVLDESERGAFHAVVDMYASRGFRTLGIAKTDASGSWRFMGLLSLYDAPREDSKQTIAAAHEMGVTVKMLTGDQRAIASEIAHELGLGTKIVQASNITKDAAGSAVQLVETADGFAEVFPEHKYEIIEALQASDHIVGMTGDGVNDAPALKRAHIGIAVSGATEAARSAADMVLLTPGLSVIVDAVAESRSIFKRMTHYALYRITETIRVLFFMTAAIIVFDFYPVTAVMIVLLALLNDGAILAIAYDHVRGSLCPERWHFKEVLTMAMVLGLLGVGQSFLLFYIADTYLALSLGMLQTLLYLKLSVAGHLTVFVTRTRGPFWSLPPATILLVAVVGTQLIATLIAGFGIFMEALPWHLVLVVWVYAGFWFVVNDTIKVLLYRWWFR